MSAYDRGKLVELFGNDPATVAVIEREFFDTACEVAREIAATDTAAGGEEALELMRRGHYDLVLADLQMPGMDGFELAGRIRSRETTERLERTPILAVTASALEDQEQRARSVGMDGLITKPIGIEQLRATLEVWLKKDLQLEAAE